MDNRQTVQVGNHVANLVPACEEKGPVDAEAGGGVADAEMEPASYYYR